MKLKNAVSTILNIEANVLRREQKQFQKNNEHVHVHIERIISSKKQLTFLSLVLARKITIVTQP